MRTYPAFLVAVLLLTGCFRGPERVMVRTVAQGFEKPVGLVAAPTGLLHVLEQQGRIVSFAPGTDTRGTFLDIRERIPAIGPGSEQGLLGLAFHPDYAANGFFYVYYSDQDGDIVLSRFTRGTGALGDPATEQVLLTIAHPRTNHYGGMLAFGPDGYLYVAIGDGGGANDPDENAQNLGVLLGKILRIDVDTGDPYGIPADNPFTGTAKARPEIWAYGLRNPWRFSFDRKTGDLWIADVGQSNREEINFQPADSAGGENYGWDVREGTICAETREECDLAGAVDPIFAYDQFPVQSITGGYVYRGAAIPALQGAYIFADYTLGRVWTLRYEGEGKPEVRERIDLRPRTLTPRVTSFGEDLDGEVYMVLYGSGRVCKVLPR